MTRSYNGFDDPALRAKTRLPVDDIVKEADFYRSSLSDYRKKQYPCGLIERLTNEVVRLRVLLNHAQDENDAPDRCTELGEGPCQTS